jgi:hypothetical protein
MAKNKITDAEQARNIPGGENTTGEAKVTGADGKAKTFIATYVFGFDDEAKDTPDTDSGTQYGNKKIAIRMKATTGVYLGLEPAEGKDLEYTIGGNGKRKGQKASMFGARGTKSFALVLKKGDDVSGSSGTRSLSIPMPGSVGVTEFTQLLPKLVKKNKNNILGFRTPNGRFYGVKVA